jgi:hypothetical protein
MLQTIEVEIDAQGVIHALQALPPRAERRAILTLVVPEQIEKSDQIDWRSFTGRLNESPNFNADPVEIQRKMRDEWS